LSCLIRHSDVFVRRPFHSFGVLLWSCVGPSNLCSSERSILPMNIYIFLLRLLLFRLRLADEFASKTHGLLFPSSRKSLRTSFRFWRQGFLRPRNQRHQRSSLSFASGERTFSFRGPHRRFSKSPVLALTAITPPSSSSLHGKDSFPLPPFFPRAPAALTGPALGRSGFQRAKGNVWPPLPTETNRAMTFPFPPLYLTVFYVP